LFTPDAEPTQVAGRGVQDHRRKRRHARGQNRFQSTQGQVGAHDTEHNNAAALADYLAAN